MSAATLLHELIAVAAERAPAATALVCGGQAWSYAALAERTRRFACGLRALGLQAGDRVGIYLEKRFETVVAAFGAAQAGCTFVPINPLLKPAQVAYILGDCGARLLVTSAARAAPLSPLWSGGEAGGACRPDFLVSVDGPPPGIDTLGWDELPAAGDPPPVAAGARAAILYTSGSTGQPKGVVLSHRNLVAGAQSVAGYLGNHPGDRLLAVLPLSFDAGFSQLTTAFAAGARAVLLNHLFPRDVLAAMADTGITGITAVPPLYIQLAALPWPEGVGRQLRYFANTGGSLPRPALDALRRRAPQARPFLMYGLTEAFRSTYLDPAEIDRRPGSIGKAIPGAEVLVLDPEGAECAAGEPGELVHRGPLVAQGYWHDPERTAQRFRPLPPRLTGGREEIAVYSGDTVYRDEEGFLYFVGRSDDMIKTSGYRVSPTEIEAVAYRHPEVAECAAFGVADPVLGQAIRLLVTPRGGLALAAGLAAELLGHCRRELPSYMVPASIELRDGPLPRNANGKIDRAALRGG